MNRIQQLFIGIFFALLLSACSNKTNYPSLSEKESSSSASSEAFKVKEEQEVTIDEDKIFSLSEEIDILKFISEKSSIKSVFEKSSEEFEISDEALENHKTHLTSICFSDIDSKKIKSEKYASNYVQKISILELLPKEILITDLDVISCSFIFHFKMEEGVYTKFAFLQVPVQLASSEKKLSLHRKGSLYESDTVSEVVKSSEEGNFLLLQKDSETVDEIEFICKDFISNNRFKIIDLLSTSVFRFLYLIKESLPEATKQCRVISYNKKRINGITDPFSLDFSSFKLAEGTLSEKEFSKINLSFEKSSLFSVHSSKKYTYDLFELRDDQIAKRNLLNYNMSGVFRFSNVEQNKAIRNSIKIEAKTTCNNKENIYVLPFREEFSIMSVFPESFFQLEYPKFVVEDHKVDKKEFTFYTRKEIKRGAGFFKRNGEEGTNVQFKYKDKIWAVRERVFKY